MHHLWADKCHGRVERSPADQWAPHPLHSPLQEQGGGTTFHHDPASYGQFGVAYHTKSTNGPKILSHEYIHAGPNYICYKLNK